MAKLIVFAAILVALLALAQASRFTITTTVDEEDFDLDNPYGGQSRRCDRQIQKQRQQLRRCEQYLSPRRRQVDEMDTTIEQYGEGQQGEKQQQLQECCQGLRNLDNRCQCEGVKYALRRALQKLGQGGQQGSQEQKSEQQIKEAARYLPQQCRLEIQQCPV